MLQFSDYINKYSNNSRKAKLIIFGAGTLGKLTAQVLKINNIEVDFYCDSDARKHNKKINNKDIISPEDLDRFEKNTDIFIDNYFILHLDMGSSKNEESNKQEHKKTKEDSEMKNQFESNL